MKSSLDEKLEHMMIMFKLTTDTIKNLEEKAKLEKFDMSEYVESLIVDDIVRSNIYDGDSISSDMFGDLY